MIISGVMGPDSKLENVAPLCTIETGGWTGSQSGEVLFTGDGTTVDFSGKVDLPPVNPLNSFTLHYTIGRNSYTATADSDGNITGEHITSGTINQDGTYEIHFDTPPDDTTDGTADYNYGIPPSNLENVLDPSNLNPSGWGWKSTTGAGFIGKLKINFDSSLVPGIYLLGIKYGFLSMDDTLTFSIKAQFYEKGLLVDTFGGEVNAITTERIFDSKGFILHVTDLTFTYQIMFYVNAKSNAKVRLYNISLFKLF